MNRPDDKSVAQDLPEGSAAFALRALVAAGHVTQRVVDQALAIAVWCAKGDATVLPTDVPSPAVSVVEEAAALVEFTEYFVANYPGPDTVICDPKWHAPRIFRAAKRALRGSEQGQRS